jgi:hypothetical protein
MGANMSIIRTALLFSLAVALGAPAYASSQFSDSQAIVEFQRKLDTYAFQHRQVERRAGAAPDQRTMADAVRVMRPSPQDGDLFTPLVAAAFHARIANALGNVGCDIPANARSSVVPRPNDDALDAAPIPACLANALPKLPVELEYRAAGVVLLLVDTHANVVIDVLHGAFPLRDN